MSEKVLAVELAVARQRVGLEKVKVAKIQAKIKDMLELTQLAAELQRAKDRLAVDTTIEKEAYAELAQAMVDGYSEDGEKQRVAGTVAVYSAYEYEAEKALQYAVERQLLGCLKLQARPFEKVVSAMGGLSFVDITEEPRARVKNDLSELL